MPGAIQTGLPDSSLPLSRDAAPCTMTSDGAGPMTWTAVAGQSPVQMPGNVVTLVRFTSVDPDSSFEQACRYDGTLAGLSAAARAVIAALNPQTAAVTVVAPDTVLDLTVPEAPAPTQAELDRAQFFADVRAERQQAKYEALSPELQARCLPEYVESL